MTRLISVLLATIVALASVTGVASPANAAPTVKNTTHPENCC